MVLSAVAAVTALHRAEGQQGTADRVGGPSPTPLLFEMCSSASLARAAETADRRGYPDPERVLDRHDRLELTAEQEASVRRILSAMLAEVGTREADFFKAEQDLHRLIATDPANEATMRGAAIKAERARGELCLVHLLARLKTRELLTDEQTNLYREARSTHRE